MQNFFKGYINYLEDKLKGKVIDLKFRDKSKGWGLLVVIYEKSGTCCEIYISIDLIIINTFRWDDLSRSLLRM